MPRMYTLEFCGLVVYMYSEEGEPHHEPHVEVSTMKGRQYKANFTLQECIIKGKEYEAGDLINGKLRNSQDLTDVKDLIQNNQQLFLTRWKELISSSPKRRPVIKIYDRTILHLDMKFVPCSEHGCRLIKVYDTKKSIRHRPGIFNFDKWLLTDKGDLSNTQWSSAKYHIKNHKDKWEDEGLWEKEGTKLLDV